jgi:hypothetical protein
MILCFRRHWHNCVECHLVYRGPVKITKLCNLELVNWRKRCVCSFSLTNPAPLLCILLKVFYFFYLLILVFRLKNHLCFLSCYELFSFSIWVLLLEKWKKSTQKINLKVFPFWFWKIFFLLRFLWQIKSEKCYRLTCITIRSIRRKHETWHDPISFSDFNLSLFSALTTDL